MIERLRERVSERLPLVDSGGLPPLIARIWGEVSNGGFGPGYGLMGYGPGGATDDQGNTADAFYAMWRGFGADEEGWSWPEGLWPLCHWGCAIYSCVDTTRSELPVVRFDPNGEDHASWLRPESPTLEAWLSAWLDGVDLWQPGL